MELMIDGTSRIDCETGGTGSPAACGADCGTTSGVAGGSETHDTNAMNKARATAAASRPAVTGERAERSIDCAENSFKLCLPATRQFGYIDRPEVGADGGRVGLSIPRLGFQRQRPGPLPGSGYQQQLRERRT